MIDHEKVRTRDARSQLLSIARRLELRYRDSSGWPGGEWPVGGRFDPPELEIVVGALLIQNTSWRNVEKALGRLEELPLVTVRALASCPQEVLWQALRPSGYFRQKALRLQTLARFIETFSEPRSFLKRVTRQDLLRLNGIGPETADSILLYACRRPSFVVDAYTRRILDRYGFVEASLKGEGLKDWLEAMLPRSSRLYRRFHAWLVEHGKACCRPEPFCRVCPLVRDCRYANARMAVSG